jgi:hypothetical protein
MKFLCGFVRIPEVVLEASGGLQTPQTPSGLASVRYKTFILLFLRSISVRILSATWWLFVAIVTALYLANLVVAILAVWSGGSLKLLVPIEVSRCNIKLVYASLHNTFTLFSTIPNNLMQAVIMMEIVFIR